MSIRIICLCGCLALLAPGRAQAEEFAANKLFVCSFDNDRVLVFAENGEAQQPVGASSVLDEPTGLAFGPDGLLYVLSAATGEVLAFEAGVDEPTLRFGIGTGLTDPSGIVILSDGTVGVGDGGNGRVMIFARNGGLLRTLDVGGTPSGLACSADGHLLVACSDRDVVQEYDAAGTLLRLLGQDSALEQAGGLAISGDGRLYVASVTTDSVLVLDGAGTSVGEVGAGTALDDPGGLAFGPDGLLYVASRGNQKIMAFSGAGQLARSFGKKLGTPTDLAFAPFRFKCSAKGVLSGEDVEKGTKQPGVLSIQPGSRRVMLDFDGDGPLSDAFGCRSLVFSGIDSVEGGNDKSRQFHGSVMADKTAIDGLLSLALVVKGKVGKHDVFEVKTAEGSLFHGSPGGVFLGSAKTGKRLK